MSGLFFLGALFAFLLGIVLLPISFIGLIVYFIGLLGLTPFLTSLVFYRNGIRAFHQAKAQMKMTGLIATLLLSLLFGLAIPSSL